MLGGFSPDIEFEKLMTSAPKVVLITGITGQDGSYLAEFLLEKGCDTICLDNFFTGTNDNIAHLLDSPYFELMRHDVTFPS